MAKTVSGRKILSSALLVWSAVCLNGAESFSPALPRKSRRASAGGSAGVRRVSIFISMSREGGEGNEGESGFAAYFNICQRCVVNDQSGVHW
jgi:hypothetical protein